jgi:AcrR family transcriptional regulator
MAPDERRQAIVAATLPLLLEQGPELSTREIAQAAGVAEGTIFRAFETKQDLIHATIHAALQPDAALDALGHLPDGQPLIDRVAAVLDVLRGEIRRTRSLFMHLAQTSGRPLPPHPPAGAKPFPPARPPFPPGKQNESRERLLAAVTSALAAYTRELAVPIDFAAQVLTALAFATSFPLIEDNPLTQSHQLALVVLHGIAKGDS